MKKNNLVSIIIPCYNQSQYLEESVQSAVDQTYPNIEIIIVNDGSPDNTEEVALELQKKHPKKIQILTQNNNGLYAARNNGIKESFGKYILPLDADDILHKEMVSNCIEAMDKNEVDIVYVDFQNFGFSNKIDKKKPFSENTILYLTPCSATSIYKRSVWEETGGYKENMKDGYEDWEFWINAYKHGFIFYYHPKILFYYRTKKESMYTIAYQKDVYLKAKIIMNHPELYTVFTVQKAIKTISATENFADLYFYTDKKLPNMDKQLLTEINYHLANNVLQKKQIINLSSQNLTIGLCRLEIITNIEYIKKLYTEMNVELILFYAPLRYKIPSLYECGFAWKSNQGIISSQGTLFEYVFKGIREKDEYQLLAHQRFDNYIENILNRVEKQNLMLANRDNAIKELKATVKKQDTLIENRDNAIKELKATVKKQDTLIENRDNAIKELKEEVKTRDNTIKDLKDLLSNKLSLLKILIIGKN